jgi:hypothetical protein
MNSGNRSTHAFLPQFTQFPTDSRQIHDLKTSSSRQTLNSVNDVNTHTHSHPQQQESSIPLNSESEPIMLGGPAPSSSTDTYDSNRQNISPTSSGLDYETFWQLQQQLGVAPLRDNLNHAAAQNQTMAAQGMGLEPYNEPMYVYNDYSHDYYIHGGGRNHSQYLQHSDYGSGSYNQEPQTASTIHPVVSSHQQLQPRLEVYISSLNQPTAPPPPPLGHASFSNNVSSSHVPYDPIQHPLPTLATQPAIHSGIGGHGFPSTEFGPALENDSHGHPTLSLNTTERESARPPPPLTLPQSSTFTSPFTSTSSSQIKSSIPASAAAPHQQQPSTYAIGYQVDERSLKSKGKKESNRKGRGKKRFRKNTDANESEDESEEDDGRKIGKGPDGQPVRL